MKKLGLFIAVVLLVGFGVYQLRSGNDEIANPFETTELSDELVSGYLFGNELVVDAQTDDYLTLDEVEEASDVIIIGEKVSEGDSTVIENEEGVAEIPYTPSEIRVRTVIEGDPALECMTLVVLEHGACYNERFLVLHAAGYEMMEIGNEYLLMLKDTARPPYYLITGMSYGKVPLRTERSRLRMHVEETDSETAEELRGLYHHHDQIREQARERYADYIEE
ncbi:MAG: hypothetical protein JJU16_04735 [Alkalibacterium sp.]|nr:hypothetical protein [Alkalibacterium sp.]